MYIITTKPLLLQSCEFEKFSTPLTMEHCKSPYFRGALIIHDDALIQKPCT